MINSSDVIGLVATILECSSKQLDLDASSQTIAGWDSMKQILILEALEEQFGITVYADDFLSAGSLRGIFEIVNRDADK